jgi:hypothetical protein
MWCKGRLSDIVGPASPSSRSTAPPRNAGLEVLPQVCGTLQGDDLIPIILQKGLRIAEIMQVIKELLGRKP